MAIFSGLFNSINGDRKYDARWFARYFATFIGNGVFPNPSTGLQVVEDSQMTTVVKAGDGWINGYFIVNDNDHILTHPNADGVFSRIDLVVMQLDYEKRTIDIVIKSGTFASTPVAPSLQRDSDIYELALAEVLIKPGVSELTQSAIKDTRLDNSVCGIVHGLVNQVDTTTLFTQYQKWFSEQEDKHMAEFNIWSANSKANFDSWFATIQNILDSNAAGNLLLLIQQNEKRIFDMLKHKYNITIPTVGWVGLVDGYYYDLHDADVYAKSIVDVNVHFKDLDFAGILVSANESFDGYVRLFAMDIPEYPMTVDLRITTEVV